MEEVQQSTPARRKLNTYTRASFMAVGILVLVNSILLTVLFFAAVRSGDAEHDPFVNISLAVLALSWLIFWEAFWSKDVVVDESGNWSVVGEIPQIALDKTPYFVATVHYIDVNANEVELARETFTVSNP